MKQRIVPALFVLCLTACLCGCGHFVPLGDEQEGSAARSSGGNEKNNQYADGIYRGFYQDGNREEVSVQFELKNDRFTSLIFRSLKYKDGDYLADGATSLQRQVANQYRQAGDYLIGKGPSAISALMEPEKIVEDMDVVTGATLNTDKLEKAVEDGLMRNVFQPDQAKAVKFSLTCRDGTYRGAYADGGVEQIAVELEIKDQRFAKVSYQALNYGKLDYLKKETSGVVKQIADQYWEAARYLEGKKVQALADLYEPPGIVEDKDAVTGPTLRTNKLISAISRALADGPAEK